jgi:hypothetical protein
MWHRAFLLLTLSSIAVLAVDESWVKVRQLGPGTELRVTKIGTRFGIVAKLSEVTEDSVIVITKTEQISVPKEDIATIEYVPATAPPLQRISRSSSTTTIDNLPIDRDAARQKPGPTRTPGPMGNSSTTYNRSSTKPVYEVIWKRPRPN